MFSAISEEGLSPQAKALLKLLKWAEKRELPKESPKENRRRIQDVRSENGNKERGGRENQGTPESAAVIEADC
jgi:hypothetical protein